MFPTMCWLSAAVCLAVYVSPSLLLEASSLSTLAAALHLVAACGMAMLAIGALLPSRADRLVVCSGRREVDNGLVVYGALHVTALFVRGRFLARVPQLVVLGMFVSLVWMRGKLCGLPTRETLVVLYAWSATAFYLCFKVESKVADSPPALKIV